MSVGYPRFETTVFAESPEISELLAPLPSVRRALFEEGVPKRFLADIYYTDPGLTLVRKESNGVVVRFGSSGWRGAIGIDVATGNVIQVIDARQKLTIPVNTALDLFTLTVKALIDRFPYYPKGAGVEQIKSVCEDLRAGVCKKIGRRGRASRRVGNPPQVGNLHHEISTRSGSMI